MKKAVYSTSATGTAATTPHLNATAGGGGGSGSGLSASSLLFLPGSCVGGATDLMMMSSSGGGSGGGASSMIAATSTLTASSPMSPALPNNYPFQSLFSSSSSSSSGGGGTLKELAHPVHADALKQHSSLTIKLLRTGKLKEQKKIKTSILLLL